MSAGNQDVCVVCSKILKVCHKDITCKKCKMYVHKKCTKLKPKELKRCNEWTCDKCCEITQNDGNYDNVNIMNLNTNVNVADIDFGKYDRMLFNPLRYENMSKDLDVNYENMSKNTDIKCEYMSQPNNSVKIFQMNKLTSLYLIFKLCLKT